MEEFHKTVWDLQHRFHDYLDKPNESMAYQMTAALQRLEDDAQNKKNPRTLEDQVKALMHMVEEAKHAQIMSPRDLDDMHDRFEELRHQLQKLM